MGVGPEKIVFAQTVKPVSHINFAKDNNVPLMTFDNEEELYKVKKNFAEAEYGFCFLFTFVIESSFR